jgi:hypothetical protein
MREPINRHRRSFFGTAAMTIVSAQLGTTAVSQASTTRLAGLPLVKPGTNTSFASLKQIDAGLLSVGYAEAGAIGGSPIVLLRLVLIRSHQSVKKQERQT